MGNELVLEALYRNNPVSGTVRHPRMIFTLIVSAPDRITDFAGRL